MIRRALGRGGLVAGAIASQFLFSPSLALAQGDDEAAAIAMLAIMAIVMGISLAVGLAISIFICWLVSSALKELPPQFQTIQPGQVWLLLIPCFNIIWNFMVFPRVSESFENYFRAVGREAEFGDCSKEVGRWYCICTALTLVAGGVAGMAGLVLLIIFLVKLSEYKREVRANMQLGKMPMG